MNVDELYNLIQSRKQRPDQGSVRIDEEFFHKLFFPDEKQTESFWKNFNEKKVMPRWLIDKIE